MELIREYTFRLPLASGDRLLRVFSEEPEKELRCAPKNPLGAITYYSDLGRQHVIDGEWMDTGEVVPQEVLRLEPVVMIALGRALCQANLYEYLEGVMA
jgi:hypothetical protein